MISPMTGADLRSRIGPVGLWTMALDFQPAARVREAVAELEELGYPAVWIPEAMQREVLTNSAVLLAATTRMTVATGIANIWGRDAMAMAAAQRTLAEAFDNRFLLGVGVSQAPVVEGVRGHRFGSPLGRMSDYLDAMDAVVYQAPPPSTAPARVLAAIGPRMLELAARRTDGAHTYFVLPEHTASARDILGPAPLLCVEQAVVLDTDPDRARSVARAYAQFYLESPPYRRDLLKHGFTEADFADGGSDKVIDAVIAWGGTEEIQARVRAHQDAGADHVCVQVLPPDPTGLPLAQWRALAPALLIP